MKKLLYLVHRLPYPPNKGDKISSNNMLNYFSARWRVHLGTFVDDPEDWQYVERVRERCEDSCIVGLPRARKITGSIAGLLGGEALSLSYYGNDELQAWVRDTIAREMPDAVLVFSGVMGRFVRDLLPPEVPVVFDAEDVDSEKWRSYARARRWPLSWLYRREADKLLAYERAMAAATDVSIFVSAEEAELFRQLAPESADKVHFRTQGVDSALFDPDLDYDNPYEPGQKVLVFTGAMDYWPNIEAVKWFCDHVLEALRAQVPELLFCIVGMKPADEVRQLEKLPGVRVTGAVPDVRPYLAHALAACLPLQLARGIQNKALEAMAMGLPVLATPDALLGIIRYPGALCHEAADAQSMVAAAVDILSRPRQYNGAGRDCVLEHYNWDTNLRRMEAFLLQEEGGQD
ncbi:MAG: sugar transferase [Halioglobus sp.]|nr:sugar transferase [Halioglobus sp.]|tara:strand:- start:936 stop:2147 length:1212 start_codon:yes stop_codon:yes gene_type:complete